MRGTHVNLVCAGACSMRCANFCGIPQYSAARHVKLSAEISGIAAYVLSVKMQDPQFAGRDQICRRVNVRHCFRRGERCLQPVAEQNDTSGGTTGRRWRLPARSGDCAAKVTQKAHQRSGTPGNWRTVPRGILIGPSCSLWKRDSARRFPPSRRAIANIQAIMPLQR